MIEITKQEVKYLEGKGYIWHRDIHSTTTRNHYYATEFPWLISDLNKYRKAVAS